MAHTATATNTTVALPPGASTFDDWQDADPQPYRVIEKATKVTDHQLTVVASAVQWIDGTVDDGRIEGPQIAIWGIDENDPLNSDQARELASVLLQTAAEVDRWLV
jgi:hypothetical protein